MTGRPDIESLVSLLESAPDPALITDDQDRIVLVNHSAESLFGYRRLELVGRSIHDFVPHPPEIVGDRTAIVARHRDGHAMRLTVSFRSIPVDHQLLTAAYFRNQDDGSAPDVSALDRLPVATFRFDAIGRLLYANAAADGVLGTRAVTYAGKTPTEFGLPSQLGQTWLEAIRDAALNAGTRRFGLAIDVGSRSRWFAGLAVAEQPAEPVHSVLVVVQDVSALHQTRTDLETAETQFRRLTEGSHDLISQHSADGRFLFTSQAALPLLQRTPEALTGTSLGDLVAEEDRARVMAAMTRAACGAPERLTTFRLLRPDGSSVWCEMTAHGSTAAGAATVSCITRDITERVRGEEILRAASRMEATATLAAGVAHDFNNLMTTILGNAELLLADPAFPDAPSRLNQVADAAKRGGALAQQLLAYARGGKYQAQTVNINDVVRQALQLQKHAIPPRIQLEADLDPSPPAIEADPVQIGQVITNLCINAAEAIPAGGRLTVRTRKVTLTDEDTARRPGTRAGPAVLIQVSDTGTGIDAAVLARIFEPFFSTKFQGRGLGLAAAYGIVKNHRGYIGVESALGRGTTFSLYFPAVCSIPDRPAVAVETFPTGEETLLLVDDDDAVIEVTKSILERLHYRVLVARHGIEAVEVARTHEGPIHLAILDLGMPFAGGAEAFPFLKAARPDMRVMISSGYEMNEVVQGMLSAGADAFLQKPYRVSALARGIREVLERRVAATRLAD